MDHQSGKELALKGLLNLHGRQTYGGVSVVRKGKNQFGFSNLLFHIHNAHF